MPSLSGYRNSKAQATDNDGINGDGDDVSYHGLLADATGRMELSHSGAVRWAGDLGLSVATRTYDSTRPPAVDPFHVGRNDTFVGFEAGIRSAWRHWEARGWFRIENNTADLGTGAS